MNILRSFIGLLVILLGLYPAAAESFRAFGLTNAPIGDAEVAFQGGTMTVTSAGSSGVAPPGNERLPAGTFGVSVQLGEADAGLWASPYHNGYVNDENFMVGQVFGDLGGQSDQAVCTVRARRESEG